MNIRYQMSIPFREWLDQETERVVNSLEEVGTIQGAVVLCDVIRGEARSGNIEARHVLGDWQIDGAAKHIRKTIKQDRTTVKLMSGREVSVPTRVGVRAVGHGGVKEKWFQQVLWYELPWERYQAMVTQLVVLRDQMSLEIAAYSRAFIYRDLFPDSRTPHEACERVGIDIRTIGFDEASIA